MPTADPEPLSDERLDMLEDDFRAGRGCFSGWGLALVAEVRTLRGALETIAREGDTWAKQWAAAVLNETGRGRA